MRPLNPIHQTGDSLEYYRALSWICVLGVLAFLIWITFAPNGFPGAPVVACLMGGSTLAALRLGAPASAPYWQSAAEPAQAPRVAQMIMVCLVVQTFVWAAQMLAEATYLPQLASMSYGATSDVVWTAIFLVFIGTRYVKWPKRVASPSKTDFIATAAIAVVLMSVLNLVTVMLYDGQRVELSLARFTTVIPTLFFKAVIEEVFFRVLLLTALIQASRSSNHALILSSVAFALMHVPGVFLQPLLEMDYSLLRYNAEEYAPRFVWQLGIGFALGALWLRTGSIVLIVTMHAIFNFAPVWLTGL